MSNTEWKKVKLGDIFDSISDKNHPEYDVLTVRSGYGTVLRSESGIDIKYKVESLPTYKLVRKGDFIIHLMSHECGLDVALHDGLISPAYSVIRCKDTSRVLCEYIKNVFHTKEFIQSIAVYATGLRVGKNIKWKDIQSIELSIPPIEEQRRIASLLSRFDDLIEINEFKADNLIRAKQQIMSDIFSGGLRVLDNINPDDYAQDNWVTVKLGDIFDIRNGYTPSKSVSEYWENGTIPWFRVEDIRENGRILSDAIQHVNIAGVKGGKLMPANSLILSTSATVGEHALVTVDCLTNQRFISCTLKSKYKNSIDLMYLFYCFYNLGEWCRDNADAGSTFSSIPTARVKEYDIKIPPTIEEQQKIANLLSSYDNLIELNRTQKQQADNMKQQLMSQLLNNGGGGQLDNS